MLQTILRKLCSRKLWVSVASFVSGLIVLNGGSQDFGDKIGGAILSGAAVLAYCIGEGLADGAVHINKEDNDNGQL